MIQALIPAITELAGGWLKGKAEEKAATAKAKVARAEAEAAVLVSAATHEAGWEKIMAKGSQNSWADEWLVGLFSIPLILSFCGEWGRTIVAEGFAALETMPDWYQYTLGVIVAASFGVRSATKFFGKK
mgnify:FL=1|tara:strand:+ start:5625 stop:6011 length:387 start_codon:yes stop_codon:yes gene_type:complete